MKKYIGVKEIEAQQLTKAGFKAITGKKHEITSEDNETEGYFIVYPDGYESWSPQDVFEAAYRETTGLTFGLAVEAAKKGAKIARTGWNGVGMYGYYVPDTVRAPLSDEEPTFDGMVRFRRHLMLKTAQNDIAHWAPSGSDVLADDWMIVE